ncbi:hypothetical protein HX870_26860 [Pseudomonas gingeri]|uniref:hypothetical protein n=1 Tax=Pseudomonas gingeri TaxID=117681 RepID=UPI0015A22713|nr:hypothetical protein [Pseudomonas gingeri]NWD71224.1 hypothetical protein [Pseudomonas gingeri]
MSYYDEQFAAWLHRETIDYKTIEQNRYENLISSIKTMFPFSGSKIEWSKTENPLNFSAKYRDDAFLEIAQKSIKSTTEILFIGDSLTAFGYRIKSADILSVLAEIFEIPQHNYIFPQNLSWAACLSMEGDIDIGELPTIPNIESNS